MEPLKQKARRGFTSEKSQPSDKRSLQQIGDRMKRNVVTESRQKIVPDATSPLGSTYGSHTLNQAQGVGLQQVVNAPKHDLRPNLPIENLSSSDKTIQQLKHELSEAVARNQILQQEVVRLQEQKFQTMTNPRFAPVEDSFVKHEMFEIQSEISKIAKKFIDSQVKKLRVRTRQEADDFRRDLCNVVRLPTTSPLAVQEELGGGSIVQRMYFTALLSRKVHQEVFANPFFFLKEKTNGTDWSLAFLDAARSACQVDSDQVVNTWQSQTLRYFVHREATENEANMQVRAAAFRRAASAAAARDFIESPARFLLRGVDSEQRLAAQRSVETVFDRAASLSMLLWSQGIVLQISSLSDLVALRFSVGSPDMKAHPLHALDDPTDNRLDGWPVTVMVHPRVTGLRMSQDTGQPSTASSTSRVFAKATVYLDRIDELCD